MYEYTHASVLLYIIAHYMKIIFLPSEMDRDDKHSTLRTSMRRFVGRYL